MPTSSSSMPSTRRSVVSPPELGVGRSHAEIEPAGVAVIRWWARRCRWWWRRRWLGQAVLPRAERAFGQREMGTELARRDAVLGVHAIERADELVLHDATTYRHGAQCEQAGRDREQRAEHRGAILTRGPRAASPSAR